MPKPFDVAVDRRGRITHFVPEGYAEVSIAPKDMAEAMDGGERVVLHDLEYDLTEKGSLIHPDVDVVEGVNLGYGVRLDRGVAFERLWASPEASDDVTIGDHARIKRAEIHEGVTIGDHALVLGQLVGHHAFVGSYTRIGIGTRISSSSVIGDTVKIDVECQIGSKATIGESARLGFNTRVGEAAHIGARARIGRFAGVAPRGVNQDGPLILPGQVVANSAKIAA